STSTAGAGGTLSITLGASGTLSGAGTAASGGSFVLTAGASTAGSATTGATGGDISLTAGAGSVAAAGGNLVYAAGAGGATGAGGNVSITSGAGGATSGNSGNVVIDAGSKTSGTAGVISIGLTNASGISIGRSGIETTFGFSATTATERLCGTQTNGSASTGVLRDCTGTPGDYAEQYGTDGMVDKADIVVLDPAKPAEEYTDWEGRKGSKAWVVKSTSAYQGTLVGVVSTEPNDVIGKNFQPSEYPQPVALSGRVPVKVNNENGEIRVGDPITSSSTPGVGMKATRSGVIVGIAQQDFSGTTGTVLVRMQPGYYFGDQVGLASLNGFYNTDGTMKVQFDGKILTADQTDTLISEKIAENALATVFPSIHADTAELGTASASGTLKMNSSAGGSVTVSAPATSTNWTMTLPTDAGQNGQVMTTDGNGNTAWVDPSVVTASLRQEIFNILGASTDTPDKSTIFGRLAKIQDQDIVGINDKLSVFSVMADPVTLVKSAAFNVQTTFNNGIQVLSDIVLAGRIKHTDQDTAGIAVIKSGFQEVHVTFDRPYSTAPIINITSQGQSAQGFVKDVTTDGFTVAVPASASADLQFSWNAVLIQNPRVSESTSSAQLSPTPTP
ncbi:MAG: hypothetical protein ACM3IJ_04395, partial [Candidatus Levyibacteriota bacterium]